MGPEELLAMTRDCGLNRLVQYAPFVSKHIRAAQQDAEVKRVLQSMRQILHTGVALNPEDEKWGLENGLVLTSMYGTSETAPLLVAKHGPTASSRLFRPCRGASPIFVPLTAENDTNASFASPLLGAARPTLYEIVVAPDALDAPAAELFSDDGYWHTDDLFEKVIPDDGEPLGWIHRGRAGDWIKTVPGFVDTKAIEDTVRRECADMPIADVLSVGTGHPRSALIVETTFGMLDDATARGLAEELARRITEPCEALFPWERIDDPRWILVVEKGRLLRNKEKGNLRRGANEELFKAEIDALFTGTGDRCRRGGQ